MKRENHNYHVFEPILTLSNFLEKLDPCYFSFFFFFFYQISSKWTSRPRFLNQKCCYIAHLNKSLRFKFSHFGSKKKITWIIVSVTQHRHFLLFFCALLAPFKTKVLRINCNYRIQGRNAALRRTNKPNYLQMHVQTLYHVKGDENVKSC